MALERKQAALEDEVRASQAVIEPHKRQLEYEYQRTCGKTYGDNLTNGEIEEDPENQRLAWLRAFLAEVAQGDPQCRIEAEGLEWPEGRAYVIEAACNQLSKRMRMKGFAHRTAVEYGFRSARAVCGLRRVGGKVTPMVRDLDFDEFLWDSTVTSRDRARWTGHYVARDVDELIAEARAEKGSPWNLDVLERIRGAMVRDPKSSAKAPSSVDRSEISYWVLHERDASLDPKRFHEGTGYHGTLHYVLDPSMVGMLRGADYDAVRSGLVRESEPWFGSWTGPHAHAAGFKIGTLQVELAPLVALATQSAFLNDIFRSVRKGAVNFKEIGVAVGDEVAAQARNTPHGWILSLPQGAQISNLFGQLKSGGISGEQIAALQLAMESAQRASGGLYSNLGEVDSDATATAINSAQVGYATTMGLYVSGIFDFYSQVFEKWAYWFDLAKEVGTRVGPVPPEMIASLRAEGAQIDERVPFIDIVGGFKTEREIENHRNIALSMDGFSVKARNEMTFQQDILAAMTMGQFFASLGPMGAAYDYDGHMRAVSRARGAKWIERLFDSGILRAIAAAQIGQQPQAPQATAMPKQQITSGPAAQGPMKTSAKVPEKV